MNSVKIKENNDTIRQKMIQFAQEKPTNILIECARILDYSCSEEENAALEVILDVLMERLPEKEFVELCETL
ncbi:hypothetical protein ADMFC3_00430 [Geovibrio sp. ADMFC3]